MLIHEINTSSLLSANLMKLNIKEFHAEFFMICQVPDNYYYRAFYKEMWIVFWPFTCVIITIGDKFILYPTALYIDLSTIMFFRSCAKKTAYLFWEYSDLLVFTSFLFIAIKQLLNMQLLSNDITHFQFWKPGNIIKHWG